MEIGKVTEYLERRAGIEPVNTGFADRIGIAFQSLARTKPHSKVLKRKHGNSLNGVEVVLRQIGIHIFLEY